MNISLDICITKAILVLSLGILFCLPLMAQKQQEVVATQGSTDTDGEIMVDWTIGEAASGISLAPNGQTTHGFNQPFLMPPTPVPTVSEWGLIGFCLLLANIGLVMIRIKSRSYEHSSEPLG